MKIHGHQHFRDIGLPRSLRSIGTVVVWLILFLGASGQLAPTQEEKTTPAPKQDPLLAKVLEELPRFEDRAAPAAEPKALAEVTTETVHLVPFVVVGDKRIKVTGSELLTSKAYAAEIFKHYDYSAFSSFQHREDVRLENMASLQNYTDSLMLAGEVDEGRAIKRETSRLFLRPHDPESEYVLAVFNPRIR